MNKNNITEEANQGFNLEPLISITKTDKYITLNKEDLKRGNNFYFIIQIILLNGTTLVISKLTSSHYP